MSTRRYDFTACYYTDPACVTPSKWGVNEFHIDLWLAGYSSCEEHLAYLSEYIKRNHNRAVVKERACPT